MASLVRRVTEYTNELMDRAIRQSISTILTWSLSTLTIDGQSELAGILMRWVGERGLWRSHSPRRFLIGLTLTLRTHPLSVQYCYAMGNLRGWRSDPESNRDSRICNPLHHHSAIGPPGAEPGIWFGRGIGVKSGLSNFSHPPTSAESAMGRQAGDKSEYPHSAASTAAGSLSIARR